MSDYIRKIRVSEIDESTGEKTETVKDIYAAKAVEADSAGSADTATALKSVALLGYKSGDSLLNLKTALDSWLATTNNYNSAMCYFPARTSELYTIWNAGDDNATIPDGESWTCTIVGSYINSSYVQLLLTTYIDGQAYYVSRTNGYWGKMRKVILDTDTVEKAINADYADNADKATNDADGNPISTTYTKNDVLEEVWSILGGLHSELTSATVRVVGKTGVLASEPATGINIARYFVNGTTMLPKGLTQTPTINNSNYISYDSTTGRAFYTLYTAEPNTSTAATITFNALSCTLAQYIEWKINQ